MKRPPQVRARLEKQLHRRAKELDNELKKIEAPAGEVASVELSADLPQ